MLDELYSAAASGLGSIDVSRAPARKAEAGWKGFSGVDRRDRTAYPGEGERSNQVRQ
jgi:hypothetical protein